MIYNSQLIHYRQKDSSTFYLVNHQERTWFEVKDAACIEMLSHMYVLRLHSQEELNNRLEGLREAKTLSQFDGLDPIEEV